MQITTRTTRAELAEIVEVVPLEMVVAGEIVAQLLRLQGWDHRSETTRRKLAVKMALQYLDINAFV